MNNNCPNCGTPLTSGYCPYCNNQNKVYTNIEYPVIECKEAVLNVWTIFLPALIAILSGVFGIIMPIMIISDEGFSKEILVTGVFTIAAIISYYIVIVNLFKFIILHIKGKKVEARVYGYIDDNMLINGIPAQVVKLLINTEEGPKFILYELGDINKPYEVNSTIKVMVYKKLFCIEKEK